MSSQIRSCGMVVAASRAAVVARRKEKVVVTYRTISKEDAIGKMRAAKGKIFTIKFKKRSTGEVRIMNCRTGVSKDVKGVGLNYSRKEHSLFGVFDMQKQAHRSVNLESLISLAMGGELYTIK